MTRIAGVVRKTGRRFDAMAESKTAKRDLRCDTCGREVQRGAVYWYVNAFMAQRVCAGCEEATVLA